MTKSTGAHPIHYARGTAEENCGHRPEAHVAYDASADGYRATLRCSCRKFQVEGSRLRKSYAEAEADGKVMAQLAQAHVAAAQKETEL